MIDLCKFCPQLDSNMQLRLQIRRITLGASIFCLASCNYDAPTSGALNLAYLVWNLRCNPCKIFVTSANNQPGVDFIGVSGADARCMSDPTYPRLGVYKALLAAPDIRVACTTANCSGGEAEHLNWVMRPVVTYLRVSDGLPVLTTNESSILAFGSLTNPWSGGVPGWWTGLNGDWTFNSACTGNTWTSSGGNARFGDPNLTTSGSISNGLDPCSTTGSKLICIEQ